MINANQKRFSKVFGAILLFAPVSTGLLRAFWLATLVGALSLFVVYSFTVLKPFFPKKLFRIAVLFFVAVLFQISLSLSQLTPFWIVSLVLLLDWNDYDPKHLGGRPLPPLVRVGIFWCGVLFQGVVGEVLGKGCGVRIFEQPAGALFSLAAFSAVILSSEMPLAPLWRTKEIKK